MLAAGGPCVLYPKVAGAMPVTPMGSAQEQGEALEEVNGENGPRTHLIMMLHGEPG